MGRLPAVFMLPASFLLSSTAKSSFQKFLNALKCVSPMHFNVNSYKTTPAPQSAPPTTPVETIEKPPESQPPKPVEPFKSEETHQNSKFPEKPAFLPPKPISHSPKISPSSIPNPSPSVTTTKQVESGYPNYGGFLYSIPGYSAFQPVAYQGLSAQNVPNNTTPQSIPNESANKNEFVLFPPKIVKETNEDKDVIDKKASVAPKTVEAPKPQTDFEDHFTTEIITPVTEAKDQSNEAKLNITSLAQCSGATVTISHTVQDIKKKQPERYSLKTSIPISKIDMKCVNAPPDASFQSNSRKKSMIPFNPAFQTSKDTRVEIQSNVVIKNAPNTDADEKPIETKQSTPPVITSNNISTLINAAEAISTSETQFWKSEQKPDSANDSKETPIAKPLATRPIFNPMNTETKVNFTNKPPEGVTEQKNQIVFINKNPSNPKMLLTISQQQNNPQVLLQRNSYDPKNMQAPSRLSSLNKKSREEQIHENNNSSKVVALKRLHQENCDENDFENLITENQIYGNKIVVKEKAQGTSQEQDLKKNSNKISSEKLSQTQDTKNLVLQPNFLYLSNLQFPANLMMIKNPAKVNPSNIENNNKMASNENKVINEASVNNDQNSNVLKNIKTPNLTINKEVHILKPNNNMLQTKSNNKTTDIVFQTNQKVIMNPQILYQVPTMIVDTDGMANNMQKLNPSTFINRDYSKFLTQNKRELPRTLDNTKQNDKLYIACPYQMDAKLQPKIVITNIRPKITTKVEEVSTLDLYEKRKRMRRLKYLTNRDPKNDIKKERNDAEKNIITPDKMQAEIFKEFTKTRTTFYEKNSDSDSDYEECELNEYKRIIETYSAAIVQETGDQRDFLINFRLATHDEYKEKVLDRQERSLRKDAVASAYIAADRIDRINGEQLPDTPMTRPVARDSSDVDATWSGEVDIATIQKKQAFFSQLQLMHVSMRFKKDYENAWQQIIKERRRRNGIPEPLKKKITKQDKMALDTKDQLQILTDIKKYVNENNNLIKKRLDMNETRDCIGDTIHMLAEKNFSELSKLSKMADRSVKIFSGQEIRKRDLKPGFDSENMTKLPKLHQQSFHKYANINIPNISKIISLKTSQEPSFASTTPATSMDEPRNSAAGSKDERRVEVTQIRDIQETTGSDSSNSWTGVEAILKSYQQFENARKKEIADLHRRNTQLRVECANANRTAAREAELARTLIAERQILATDEHNVRLSVQRLMNAVDAITKYC